MSGTSPSPTPRRGEVWWFDPDPVVGRELGRTVRPALVVSIDEMHQGGGEKVIVVPSTTTDTGITSHVPYRFTRDGRMTTAYFCCEHVRSISRERLKGRMMPGIVSQQVMVNVEGWLRILMGLDRP